MLDTIIKRRAQVSKLIEGIWFIVPPGSLEEDTNISASMTHGNGCIGFKFSPDGVAFAKDKPALLVVTRHAITSLGVSDYMLYGEDGSAIHPFKRSCEDDEDWEELEYDIKGFNFSSLGSFPSYYFMK